MKWIDKGHQFEEFGNYLRKIDKIYLLGESYEAKNAFGLLTFLGCNVSIVRIRGAASSFFKTSFMYTITHVKKGDFASIKRQIYRRINLRVPVKKQNEEENVYSSIERVKYDSNHSMIVFTFKDTEEKLEDQADNLGYTLGKNAFNLETFLKKIVSIYMLYKYDKVYFHTNNIVVSTRCTLNCEKCLDFVPYNKNKVDISADVLKSDVDMFFNCVDCVGEFSLTGGEALLNRQLSDFLEYLCCNYMDRIYNLYLISNGTVIPDRKLMQVLIKYDIAIKIDDYTKEVKGLKNKFDRVIRTLTENKVRYEVYEVKDWFDLFPIKTHCVLSEKQLIEKYDKCANGFMELKDGKICTCNYAGFAATAEIIKPNEKDYFDLASYTKQKKSELVEFRLGYSQKGYTDFCRMCNGFPSINDLPPVRAAKQADGLLNL